MLEVLEEMRCMLFCISEAVEGGVGGVGRAGRAGGDGGDALCAALYMDAVEGGLCLLDVLEVLEVMRRVLFCMLEAVEGGLCLLDVLEVIRCVLLCMPEMLEMLEMLEVMRCMLLYLLEVLDVPEVIRCADKFRLWPFSGYARGTTVRLPRTIII